MKIKTEIQTPSCVITLPQWTLFWRNFWSDMISLWYLCRSSNYHQKTLWTDELKIYFIVICILFCPLPFLLRSAWSFVYLVLVLHGTWICSLFHHRGMYSGGSWCSLVWIQKNKRYIYVIKKSWLKTKTDRKTIQK